MAVRADGTGPTRQADASGLVSLKFEYLVIDRHHLVNPSAVMLRLQRSLVAGAGVAIHCLAAQAITARQVVGRGDHVQTRGRVIQGFPQKILELDLAAKTKPAPVGVSRDGVARHGFTGHTQGQLPAVAQLPGSLAQQFETGGADALHPQCRDRLRHPAVQADMPWQQVGIETGLGHGAGQNAVHCLRFNTRTGQYLTAHLDPQVDG
ncbi:hypothetical protein [Pseudomonas sp. 44 R 15]|nr:hypothetical protein [Pseudomonas sp. 44 R 15]